MADINVTISIIDAHAAVIADALATPDPPGMASPRLQMYDRVTGTAIPIQSITLP